MTAYIVCFFVCECKIILSSMAQSCFVFSVCKFVMELTIHARVFCVSFFFFSFAKNSRAGIIIGNSNRKTSTHHLKKHKKTQNRNKKNEMQTFVFLLCNFKIPIVVFNPFNFNRVISNHLINFRVLH